MRQVLGRLLLAGAAAAKEELLSRDGAPQAIEPGGRTSRNTLRGESEKEDLVSRRKPRFPRRAPRRDVLDPEFPSAEANAAPNSPSKDQSARLQAASVWSREAETRNRWSAEAATEVTLSACPTNSRLRRGPPGRRVKRLMPKR